MVVTRDSQHVWKVNVWCGIINNQVIGPFIIEGNQTSNSYCSFLTNELDQLLENVPLYTRQNMIFQQDNCPAHTSRAARQILNQKFPNRWIGKFGPVPWPARSPDLTILDYYFWGRLKDMVYIQPPTTRHDMIQRIKTAISNISREEILNATNNFPLRVTKCLEVEGGHFEQLI